VLNFQHLAEILIVLFAEALLLKELNSNHNSNIYDNLISN